MKSSGGLWKRKSDRKPDMGLACSSNSRGGLTQALDELRRSYEYLWEHAATGIPAVGRTYLQEEQSVRQGKGEEILERIKRELRRPPRTVSEQEATREHFFSLVAEFVQSTLDLPERHLQIILSPEFNETAACFSFAARYFDPNISQEDIFQAARNAVAMNAIQYLAGVPVSLTPAIFAYSLLYPYTDNYLDDPFVTNRAKEAFNDRLARRLLGEMVSPEDKREEFVYELVGMIEAQYNREGYPQVFESLSYLHRAQTRSLRLLAPIEPVTEDEILGISFDKGGSSVVADGCLVAGWLSEARVDFLYGLGAFLQLVDDLQDLYRDLSVGAHTIFSESAGRSTLEEIVNRTFYLGSQVIARAGCFNDPKAGSLKELMEWSVFFLLEEAVGRAGNLFSPGYLDQVESRLPFRFAFLEEQRIQITRELPAIIRFFEAFNSKGSSEASHWGQIKELIDQRRPQPG